MYPRVSETGYWSPTGLKSACFDCGTDALNQPKCLAGTPHQNSSEAYVNECAEVRPIPTDEIICPQRISTYSALCRVFQGYRGVKCYRCNEGYYPLIGLCLKCPEVGVTAKNVGNVIATYGGVWLLWLIINRVISEELVFMDTICNFCQVTGALGGFSLNWPGCCSHLAFE